jgi:hypothetical protein
MTYKMHKTKLEGYPIQYGEEVVKNLNLAFNGGIWVRKDIQDISRDLVRCGKINISRFGLKFPPYKTKDGYEWFAETGFNWNGNVSKVAILFPLARDFKDLESNLDRSINVYSNLYVEEREIKEVTDKLAKLIHKEKIKRLRTLGDEFQLKLREKFKDIEPYCYFK